MDYLASDKIAVIDLPTGEIIEEDLDDDLVNENIGGAGITKALYEQYEDSDPVVLGAGLLTGALVPGSALGVMTAKSPVTGRVCHAPLCLDVGMELKYSGFDYIVLKGEAPNPVFLWIHDGIADVKDAADLWGKDVWQATDAVRQTMGDDLIQTMAIGPAGENQSELAAVSLNYWGGGDCFGFGGVLGRKKVKMLAIRGMGLFELAEPEEFVETSFALLTEVKQGAWAGKQGLAELAAALGEPDAPDWLAPITHRHRACFNTPYATNTYVYFEDDPAQMTEPAQDEPGFLLTDIYGVLGFKKLGLSAPETGRALMACAKYGLDPAAVADLSEKSGATTLEAIENSLATLSGPAASADSSVFSNWCPQSPVFGDFGAVDDAWRNRRLAVAHIFGIHPVLALMAPEITNEKLLELANLGAELELTEEGLDEVVGRILD